VVNENLVRAVEGKIMEKRRLTITSFSMHFPQISQSLLHRIVSDKLMFWKLCALWVPKMLTEKQIEMAGQGATTGFASQVASFFDEGIQKLVQRYDKCLSNGGHHVRK